MPKQVLPDLAIDVPVPARPHWVKVRFPDKNTPVGIVHSWVHLPHGEPLWVFDHRTDDTMVPPGIVSPMGLDVGVYGYLRRQLPPIDEVHFWPDHSTVMLHVPFAAFEARRMDAQNVRTVTGDWRTRIFVPTEEWRVLPFYPETRPSYWDVTQLTEQGQIEAQHVAVPR